MVGSQVISSSAVSAMDVPVRGSRTITTLYDVLGVRSDADTESIERAFREATKAYHPDLHGGDQAAVSRFQDILAAVAVLRDPDQRAAYDLKLRRRRRREWLDAANLCVVACAIIGGGLVIGTLVLSATPPRIALEGRPSVAAAGQPGEARVRMEPDKGQIRTQPDTDSSVVQKPDTSVTVSGLAVASRDSVQPEPAGETALAPVAPAEPSKPHLDASEIASLMKRGTEFVANGNIGAARMMLKLAAEAGDAAAAFAFAETYDPSVLEKLGAKGITPDVGLAQQWYEKARALGSTETPGQLSGLPAAGRDSAMAGPDLLERRQQPREWSER
jgi:hypothetical protein